MHVQAKIVDGENFIHKLLKVEVYSKPNKITGLKHFVLVIVNAKGEAVLMHKIVVKLIFPVKEDLNVESTKMIEENFNLIN